MTFDPSMTAETLEPVLRLVQNDPETALARLDQLLQISDDPRLHFLRGSVLASLERYGEARIAMRRAIDLAPDYAVARFQLGLLELSSADAAAALATWSPLLELTRDNPLRLFAEGLATMLTGDLVNAIRLLEEGIALNIELPPMNHDMRLMIAQMTEKLEVSAPVTEIASDADFLLRQYSFKETKH